MGRKNPSKIDVQNVLEHVEDATLGEEMEAKIQGKNLDDFQEETKDYYGVSREHLLSPEDVQAMPLIDFVNDWEKENREIDTTGTEQLTPQLEFKNDTGIYMSRAFLSYVLKKVRGDEMGSINKNDVFTKEANRLLKNLVNVLKIEVRFTHDNKRLHFSVYVKNGVVLKDKNLFYFNLDSKGNVSML